MQRQHELSLVPNKTEESERKGPCCRVRVQKVQMQGSYCLACVAYSTICAVC